jgi:hypothetical protein
MPDPHVIAARDLATLAADHDATERWNRWLQGGRVRDDRNRRRMGIFATSVAVALAGTLAWVMLTAS